MRITGRIKQDYETLLTSTGEGRFYKHVLGSAVIAKYESGHPEIVMLDQAEDFFALYRRTGNENYFTIGRLLRRASHRLYREFNREDDKDFPVNRRFLNVVK